MNGIQIRELTAEDARLFRALRLEALEWHPAAFAASDADERAWTVDDVARRLRPTPDSYVMGAFDEAAKLVGCVGWYRAHGTKLRHRSHVWGVYVRPAHRRQGIARALIQHILGRVRGIPGLVQVELSVMASNPAASGFYEGLGFRHVATLPRALRSGWDYHDEQLYVLAWGSAVDPGSPQVQGG